MRKPQETAADRIWKETVEACPSLEEGVVLLVLIAALVAGMVLGT